MWWSTGRDQVIQKSKQMLIQQCLQQDLDMARNDTGRLLEATPGFRRILHYQNLPEAIGPKKLLSWIKQVQWTRTTNRDVLFRGGTIQTDIRVLQDGTPQYFFLHTSDILKKECHTSDLREDSSSWWWRWSRKHRCN